LTFFFTISLMRMNERLQHLVWAYRPMEESSYRISAL